MDGVVDLSRWRRSHPGGQAHIPRAVPSGSGPEPGREAEVERVERAIRRLDTLASRALEGGSELEPWVETELLAIMGALSMDLLDDAATRAERLAARLSRPASTFGR